MTGGTAVARGGGYSALIQRASYGVPHITARDFASLGYGVGYAQAEDNICLIAEQMVTVNGQRSRCSARTPTTSPATCSTRRRSTTGPPSAGSSAGATA